MRGLRADQVEREEGEVENPLHPKDHQALEQGRLGHLDESHQVHPLVLGLIHQSADPSFVVAHPAQALQMVDGCPDHAGYGGDSLQHDRTVSVALGEERIGAKAQHLGEAEGDAVRHALR